MSLSLGMMNTSYIYLSLSLIGTIYQIHEEKLKFVSFKARILIFLLWPLYTELLLTFPKQGQNLTK